MDYWLPIGAIQIHRQKGLSVSGQKDFFWAGSSLLNVTDKGPISSGGVRWNEFLPQFIHDNILSTGLWDGVFLDNTFDAISYYAKSPVDLDRDGRDLTGRDDAEGADGQVVDLAIGIHRDPL